LATPRFMIFGTGGAAYGETNSYLNYSNTSPTNFGISKSGTNWGWTAGGGFEYAITDNVTLKTEYLYVDLGSQNLFSAGGGGAPFGFNLDVDTHFHTVKAGLNFLFN
jgi:outer membrane immunogenic protein